MADVLSDNLPQPGVTLYSSRESTQGDVHWRIETIEPIGLNFQNFIVQGQLPIADEGITLRDSQSIPEVSSYGVPQPFIQWVRGELQTISFPCLLYSRDRQEDIKQIYDSFRRLQTWTPELRRTPLCRFSYGSILSMKVMVRGFGDVKIARPKPDGSARKIEFTMTLAKWKPYTLNEVDVTKPQSESRMQICSGDTRMYETLARKEYGDNFAIYGDRLRKRNRKNGFAVPDGERTKVPSAAIILKERIVQDFHGFRQDKPAVANMLNDKINARRNRVLVY